MSQKWWYKNHCFRNGNIPHNTYVLLWAGNRHWKFKSQLQQAEIQRSIL